MALKFLPHLQKTKRIGGSVVPTRPTEVVVVSPIISSFLSQRRRVASFPKTNNNNNNNNYDSFQQRISKYYGKAFFSTTPIVSNTLNPGMNSYSPHSSLDPAAITSDKLSNQMKVTVSSEVTVEEFKSLLKDLPIMLCEIKEPPKKKGACLVVVNFQNVHDLYKAYLRIHGKSVTIPNTEKAVSIKCKIYDASLDPLYEITNREIEQQLPRGHFKGKITLVSSEKDLEPAFASLLGKPLSEVKDTEEIVLGMDTEWRPNTNIEYNRTSMLQLTSNEQAVLFRLHLLGNPLPPLLVKLLQHKSIRKVGVNLDFDILKLQKDFSVKSSGTFDIAKLPIISRCRPKTLQALTGIFLGFRPDKSNRMGNWEDRVLTEEQLLYAATDAFCNLQLYLKLNKITYHPDLKIPQYFIDSYNTNSKVTPLPS